MASQRPGLALTCLICFKSRPLKTVGNCKHSFCTECLSTVLESLETGSVTFACPSCKVDYPRPQDGVQGMVDFSGETDNVTVADTQTAAENEDITDEMTDIICDLCCHKQRKVKASNTCAECDHLHICKDCSKTHRLNKFTSSHFLTPIATKRNKKELLCEPHEKLFKCFCKTCQEPVCMVCVSLNHGDHDVERLADVIRSKEAEVKVTLGVKAKKLKELQQLKRELMLMKSMATEVDTQDTLIKEIEDHAEKLIDQIIKWKDNLKKEVKKEFQVVRDIPVYLEKVSEKIQDLQETVNKANQVQGDCENHPVYLDKLVKLQQELAPAGETQDEIQVKELQNQLLDLKRNDRSFLSESGRASYGEIHKTAELCNRLNQQHIFEHTMTADSEDKFIPCVSILSPKFFAVAHPVKSGKLSVAIDIYEFPGTLKRTLKDHVPPIYDMSSTPRCHLVVLSGAAQGGSCNVKVFDPETGYISSTQDIELAKPLSMGVTMHSQYVILGVNDQGQSQITVVDEYGVVELQQVIEGAGISNPKRITCGWRHFFVSADGKIITYEINNSGTPMIIKQVSTMEYSQTRDITATQWDDLFIAWTGSYVGLSLYQEESFKGGNKVHDKRIRGDMEARICTKDGQHVVISYGQTIKVVKYSFKA